MYRGCLSDSSQARLMCGLDETDQRGVCVKCSTSGCNNQPKFDKPRLSCLKCQNDKECAFGQDASRARRCIKDLMFGDEETCFTQVINGNFEFMFDFFSIFMHIQMFSQGTQVKRDCTLDIDSPLNSNWCIEEENCEKCSKNGCNSNNGRYMWCLHCKDSMEDKCTTLPNVLEYINQCDYKPYTYDRRGCFTRYQGMNGIS